MLIDKQEQSGGNVPDIATSFFVESCSHQEFG